MAGQTKKGGRKTSDTPKPGNILARRVLLDRTIPPRAANQFFWTRVGDEFVFEVGFADLVEVKEAIDTARKTGKEQVTDILISDRFSLSPDAVDRLITTVNAIKRDVQQRKAAKSSADSN